jgi:hypothetical protein
LKHTNWKDIAELLGIAAIVASLVFVGLQLKQEDEVAQLEMFDRSVEQQREFADWITQHAEIWQRGCIGEELSDTDQLVFAQIYNVYINHTYLRWLRFKVSDFAGGDGQYLIDSFAANIHRYPGILAVGEERLEWAEEGRRYTDRYLAEFLDLTAARLEELKFIEPNPERDAKFCGT